MIGNKFQWHVTGDESRFLDLFLEILRKLDVPFCITGAHAISAYSEPMVTHDLDVVVDATRLTELDQVLPTQFVVEKFLDWWRVSKGGSELRVQIQMDARFQPFISRSCNYVVLGRLVPVASHEDVLQEKLWTYHDKTRPPVKRQMDLAHIAQLVQAHPELTSKVPQEIKQKLL
jgi:hypothetical protein